MQRSTRATNAPSTELAGGDAPRRERQQLATACALGALYAELLGNRYISLVITSNYWVITIPRIFLVILGDGHSAEYRAACRARAGPRARSAFTVPEPPCPPSPAPVPGPDRRAGTAGARLTFIPSSQSTAVFLTTVVLYWT